MSILDFLLFKSSSWVIYFHKIFTPPPGEQLLSK